MDFFLTRSFWLLNMLTDGLKRCGLLVYYWDVFISFLNSHSDGTHSLQSIHWWWCYDAFFQVCSDEETNSSTSYMAWRWVKVSANTIFFVRAIAFNFACMLLSSSGTKISRANSPCYHVIKTSSCITAVWLSESFISADFFLWSRLCIYFFFVVKNDQPLTQLVCMLNKQKRGRAVLFSVFHVCCE